MLSYRHGFHAGNHADVLKHLVQSLVIEYLTRKDKPVRYIDTHSATGGYELDHEFARKTAEWVDGIGKIWKQADLPEQLGTYLDVVKEFNNNQQKLKLYPGSPSIAAALLREQDRLSLFELHPADSRQLARNFERDQRVRVTQDNGFAALKSQLPPLEKRALVLIDPPYEVKDDYNTVIKSLKEAFKRFAVGIYGVWYPLLDSEHSRSFGHKLERCGAQRWLHVTLNVRNSNTAGMYGSGMFVINPPWLLEQQLIEVMPRLVKLLGENPDAGYTLKTCGLD